MTKVFNKSIFIALLIFSFFFFAKISVIKAQSVCNPPPDYCIGQVIVTEAYNPQIDLSTGVCSYSTRQVPKSCGATCETSYITKYINTGLPPWAPDDCTGLPQGTTCCVNDSGGGPGGGPGGDCTSDSQCPSGQVCNGGTCEIANTGACGVECFPGGVGTGGCGIGLGCSDQWHCPEENQPGGNCNYCSNTPTPGGCYKACWGNACNGGSTPPPDPYYPIRGKIRNKNNSNPSTNGINGVPVRVFTSYGGGKTRTATTYGNGYFEVSDLLKQSEINAGAQYQVKPVWNDNPQQAPIGYQPPANPTNTTASWNTCSNRHTIYIDPAYNCQDPDNAQADCAEGGNCNFEYTPAPYPIQGRVVSDGTPATGIINVPVQVTLGDGVTNRVAYTDANGYFLVSDNTFFTHPMASTGTQYQVKPVWNNNPQQAPGGYLAPAHPTNNSASWNTCVNQHTGYNEVAYNCQNPIAPQGDCADGGNCNFQYVAQNVTNPPTAGFTRIEALEPIYTGTGAFPGSINVPTGTQLRLNSIANDVDADLAQTSVWVRQFNSSGWIPNATWQRINIGYCGSNCSSLPLNGTTWNITAAAGTQWWVVANAENTTPISPSTACSGNPNNPNTPNPPVPGWANCGSTSRFVVNVTAASSTATINGNINVVSENTCTPNGSTFSPASGDPVSIIYYPGSAGQHSTTTTSNTFVIPNVPTGSGTITASGSVAASSANNTYVLECINGNQVSGNSAPLTVTAPSTNVTLSYSIVPPGPWFTGINGDVYSESSIVNTIPDGTSGSDVFDFFTVSHLNFGNVYSAVALAKGGLNSNLIAESGQYVSTMSNDTSFFPQGFNFDPPTQCSGASNPCQVSNLDNISSGNAYTITRNNLNTWLQSGVVNNTKTYNINGPTGVAVVYVTGSGTINFGHKLKAQSGNASRILFVTNASVQINQNVGSSSSSPTTVDIDAAIITSRDIRYMPFTTGVRTTIVTEGPQVAYNTGVGAPSIEFDRDIGAVANSQRPSEAVLFNPTYLLHLSENSGMLVSDVLWVVEE